MTLPTPRHAIYDPQTQTLSYHTPERWATVATGANDLPYVCGTAVGGDVRDIWCRVLPREWSDASRPEHAILNTAVSRDGRFRAIMYTDLRRRVFFLHDWGDTRWPGALHADPAATLALYDAFSAAIDDPFGFSPGGLGLGVLLRTVHRHPEWFRPERLPLTPHHPRQTFVRLPREDDGPYIHCLDMHAAFFAVARSLRFPTGAAMHLADPRLLFGPVGFATTEHAALAKVTYNRSTPGPLRREGWHAQSVYRAALSHGQSPTVLDAYVYSQRHEALRDWAETLLRVYRALLPATAKPMRPILSALWKSVYIGAIGRLASAPDWGGDKWYHLPLWHAMIEGEVARRAWSLAGPAEHPSALCLLTDELLFASHDPDPDELCARIGMAPGQLRHRWTRRGVPPAALAAAQRGDAVGFRDAVRDD